MSATAPSPRPIASPAVAGNDATRYMCASIYLGRAEEIRKKLTAHIADRYHATADNYGLDVPLIARVLDYYDQHRLRFLAWHGPVGLLAFLTLGAMVGAVDPGSQAVVIGIFIIAAVALAIPAYRQYMRNHFEYPLRYFGRGTFAPQAVREAFNNSRQHFEREAAERERPGNLTIYGGFEPFVGAGTSFGTWSLLIDSRKGAEGESPKTFVEQDLEDAIGSAFRRLNLPGMQVSERLFVHGSDVASIDGVLPNRFMRPIQNVAEPILAQFRHVDAREARVYQSVSVPVWGDQVRVSFFYRMAFRGPMLYIENHAYVLQPVSLEFRKVDDVVPAKTKRKIATFVGFALLYVLAGMLASIAECLMLLHLLQKRREAKQQDRLQKKLIEQQARYNYGAADSLRESVASGIYDHYFEKSDRDLYVKALQKQLLDAILEFLDSRHIDTSDLRDQSTYIINSGLIVHGGLQAGAVAVGESATAATEAKKPRAKRAQAGGKAA
jgi:hypothetical protein